MPRTKFTDHVARQLEADRQARRDRIREKIQGAYREQGKPIEAISKALGLSRSVTYTRLSQPGDKWELRELIVTAGCLHIPMDELTPFMTSQYYGGAGR